MKSPTLGAIAFLLMMVALSVGHLNTPAVAAGYDAHPGIIMDDAHPGIIMDD